MRPRRAGPRPPSAAADGHRRPTLRRGLVIVHEDDDLIVVDKPTGIISADPASGGDGGRRSARAGNTVFDILKEHVRARGPHSAAAGKPARGRGHSRDQGVWIVHRLDKEASGLLVFAKSLRAFNWLKEDLRAKRLQREYLAVAEGVLGKPGESRSIQTFMEDDRSPRPAGGIRRPQGTSGGPGSRLAVTHFTVIAASQERTLVRVRLDTGRKNQIRIHFADQGHPLVGDRKFGASSDPLQRLALHATGLAFVHPMTGRAMSWTSPPPSAFYRIVGLPPPPPEPEGAENAVPVAAAAANMAAAGRTRPNEPPAAAPARPGPATSWDTVAEWYDQLLDEAGNDHYEQVILPGAMRLLEPRPGMRVLDVACGQGILSRRLAAAGVECLGIEASPRLVQAAERRARQEGLSARAEFRVGDARDLVEMGLDGFDAAACVMALGNIEPVSPVFAGIARALRPGGRLVWIITHPAFRAVGQTSWGWDAKSQRQFRRVDGYLSPGQKPIKMNPGKAAHGRPAETTWTFHRPLQAYVESMSAAGLLIERLEEWPSLRASTSGPRAAEENRARREIPLFLGIRALLAPRSGQT